MINKQTEENEVQIDSRLLSEDIDNIPPSTDDEYEESDYQIDNNNPFGY